MQKGIDVSCWNGQVDWSAVKAAGIQFAMIRAGLGDDISQIDSEFKRNIEGALANGIHVGVYWMSYATSAADAVKEAKVCKQIITPYSGKIDYPVCFDWEYDSEDYFVRQTGRHPTDEEISYMVKAFCDEISKGCWKAANYQNLDYTYHKLVPSIVKGIDIWLADYNGSPDVPCKIQQTSCDSRVNGIHSSVDTDISFVDYPSIIKQAKLNGYVSTVANSDARSVNIGKNMPYSIGLSKMPDKINQTGCDIFTGSAAINNPNTASRWPIIVPIKTLGKSGYGHLDIYFGGQKITVNINVK
jgi:GH25 family lysozyme M1 (1,4-beta-N-acetylmuramidase)